MMLVPDNPAHDRAQATNGTEIDQPRRLVLDQTKIDAMVEH
jgi:hypothetical protein